MNQNHTARNVTIVILALIIGGIVGFFIAKGGSMNQGASVYGIGAVAKPTAITTTNSLPSGTASVSTPDSKGNTTITFSGNNNPNPAGITLAQCINICQAAIHNGATRCIYNHVDGTCTASISYRGATSGNIN